MFTVIICDKSVIKDCTSKYKIHLKPLLDNKDYAFCYWNPQGETLGEAVPELKKIVSVKKEWRAVVLADSRTGVLSHEKRNPFDVVNYQKPDKKFVTVEQIQEYRDYVKTSTQKAIDNPLLKLSVWLGGAAIRVCPIAPDDDFLDVPLCSDEYEKVRKEYNCSIRDFEISIARAYRFKRIYDNFELGGELFNPPKSIIAVTERSIDTEQIQAAAAWVKHTEYDYSNFIEDNLYSNKMRCLVYDLPRVKGKIKENDYFKYLITVMILAENDIHSDAIKFGKLYELSTLVDDFRIGRLCNDYIFKLNRTMKKLDELKYCHKVESCRSMDDMQAQKEFESEKSIAVSISREYDKETLMSEYNEIGLAKDCPGDEDSYWSSQHHAIRKHFNRFLRQPQRSLEKAVETDFRRIEDIDTEKAKRLNKFQREDIMFKLYEEEQKMLETQTTKLYDKAEFDRILNDANKEVKQEISQRMKKKNTIIAGAITLALFLIGFIPLFVSELNNFGTFAISLLLTGISIAVVAASIIITLLYFKHRIIKRFKHFNSEMSGIYERIMGSLKQFSKYLSHAGNVMREFAVLNAYEDKNNDLLRVYKKHEIDIENNMTSIMALFSDYIVEDYKPDIEIRPYKYDFDKPYTYGYEMPYEKTCTEIEFLQGGNRIFVPIDFIKSIKLRREELYD